MQRFIYLAGPIKDCDKGQANDWRTRIQSALPNGVVGISPLRCEPLIGKTYKATYTDVRFGTASAITAKNRFDTLNCDMVLAYLPKELTNIRPSVGTTLELGWAMAIEKPIILVTDDPAYSEHPLIQRKVDWIVDDFDTALEIIQGLFTDYIKAA